MPRIVLLIVALWAVALAPALCTAGVLAHECRCVEDAPCDHETDCEVDPCADQILRKDGGQGEVAAAAGTSLPAVAPDAAGLVPRRDHRAEFAAPAPDPVPPIGAAHATDLPLLS